MVRHERRPTHDSRCPAHVTLRTTLDVPSLRSSGTFDVLRNALTASSRSGLRVLHFSAQRDHVHLLVEADSHRQLTRGLQGLAIRAAKAINRALERRGKVWADRYHARLLRTPREVRHALVYVLQNFRKHLAGARGWDACSSALWFDGWRTAVRTPEHAAKPVATARTWLVRVGWRRWGLVDMREGPRKRPHRERSVGSKAH